MITVTTFKWVPHFAQGLVRDLRVRWALEEAGLPYEIKLIGFEACDTPQYRALQPFGQVPVYEQDGLTLFESGAIVLHVAEQSAQLMPEDSTHRAQVRTWMFAALNSVETATQGLAIIDHQSGKDSEWARLRRPQMVEFTRRRLKGLADALGEREYLVAGGFSAADILMVTSVHPELLAFSGIPLRRTINEADQQEYQRALAAPATHAAIVLALDGDDVDRAVKAHPQGLRKVLRVSPPNEPAATIYVAHTPPGSARP